MSKFHYLKQGSLLVLLGVFCTFCYIRADVFYEACTTEELIAKCDEQKRVCIKAMDALDLIGDNETQSVSNFTNVTEYCHECMEGYIPAMSSRVVPEGTCFPIANITWDEYVQAFDPILKDVLSETLRLELVKLIAELISKHNSQIPPPDFFLQVNHLSALSKDEIKQRNGYRTTNEKESELPLIDFSKSGGKPRPHKDVNSTRWLQSSLPTNVDWVSMGAVTSVKNQGQCGCCWTISTVGAIEGITAIDTNYDYVESLSFQQLISCDTANDGCNGGSVTSAMQYAASNSLGGLTTDVQYPFTDIEGTTTTQCSAADLAVEIWDPNMITTTSSPNNYQDRINQMKQGVAQQPVSILINANCQEFQSYSGGVMTSDGGCACNNQNCLDHAVLMVGYNDDYNPPYWLVKNSWGTGWGESGYIRVAQTASDSSQYGLLGLLAQGSIPSRATNTTVEIPSSVIPVVAHSAILTTILSSLVSAIYSFY